MQITINNYKRLKRHPLKFDDTICWNIDNQLFRGRVDSGYIEIRGFGNDKIFRELNIAKYSFCSKLYGYETRDGDWPWADPDDYEGLSKVVIALFDIINENNKKQLQET